MCRLKYHNQIKDAIDSVNSLPQEEYTTDDSKAYHWLRDNRPTYQITKDEVVKLRMFCERLPIGIIDYIQNCYHIL